MKLGFKQLLLLLPLEHSSGRWGCSRGFGARIVLWAPVCHTKSLAGRWGFWGRVGIRIQVVGSNLLLLQLPLKQFVCQVGL